MYPVRSSLGHICLQVVVFCIVYTSSSVHAGHFSSAHPKHYEIIEAKGTDNILTSPNFPFNYTNGLHMNYFLTTSPFETVVCMRLHYFDTEDGKDLLEITGYRLVNGHEDYGRYTFSGVGRQHRTIYTIWDKPLCWRYKARSSVQISFLSDESVTARGFYLTYDVMSDSMYAYYSRVNGLSAVSASPIPIHEVTRCDFSLGECKPLIETTVWTTAQYSQHADGRQGAFFHPVGAFGTTSFSLNIGVLNAVSCLSFKYKLNGPGTKLYLKYRASQSSEVHGFWMRTGFYANEWLDAHIPLVSTPYYYSIQFQAELNGNTPDSIGIDDISILKGRCPAKASYNCRVGFQSEICDWHNDMFDTSPKYKQGGLHTNRQDDREYTCRQDTCTLTSPSLSQTSSMCLVLYLRNIDPSTNTKYIDIDGTPYAIPPQTQLEGHKFDVQKTFGAELQRNIKVAAQRFIDISYMDVVPLSCSQIELQRCDIDEFMCDIHQCEALISVCDGTHHCKNGMDESNCTKGPQDLQNSGGFDMQHIGIIAVIVGCIIIMLLICFKLTYTCCEHRRRRRLRSQASRLQMFRDELARNRGEGEVHLTESPPGYEECMRGNNLAFVPDDEADKADLPSYNQVLDGSFTLLTIPKASEVQRLREEMVQNSRVLEEETSSDVMNESQVGGRNDTSQTSGLTSLHTQDAMNVENGSQLDTNNQDTSICIIHRNEMENHTTTVATSPTQAVVTLPDVIPEVTSDSHGSENQELPPGQDVSPNNMTVAADFEIHI